MSKPYINIHTKAGRKTQRDLDLEEVLKKELEEFEPQFKFIFGDLNSIRMVDLRSRLKKKDIKIEEKNMINSQILYCIKKQIMIRKEEEND